MEKLLKRSYDSKKFNFHHEKLMPLLVHEYIHLMQFTSAIKKRNIRLMIGDVWGLAKVNPFPNKQTYLNRPHEQAAWGHGFIETLKKFGKNPESIILFLKKYGVTGQDDLQRLKKRDYEGWKNLMKSAVSAAQYK
jgi:hypothetical protein